MEISIFYNESHEPHSLLKGGVIDKLPDENIVLLKIQDGSSTLFGNEKHGD